MSIKLKKQNWKLAAEVKTIADYALILEHCNGYERDESVKLAGQSKGETLFEKLHARNKELFRAGDIIMMDAKPEKQQP